MVKSHDQWQTQVSGLSGVGWVAPLYAPVIQVDLLVIK